jgi:hypothetical protein
MFVGGEDNCYDDKLIVKEIEDLRQSEISRYQVNPGIASMRFSGTSESSGMPTIVGLKTDHDDGDTESVRRFRAESLSS